MGVAGMGGEDIGNNREGSDVKIWLKLWEDCVFAGGGEAEHFGVPRRDGDAAFLTDCIVDNDVASGKGGVFGPALAFIPEGAGSGGSGKTYVMVVGAVCGLVLTYVIGLVLSGWGVAEAGGWAGFEDIEHAPGEEGAAVGSALAEEVVHDAVGEVHSAEALDGAVDEEVAALLAAGDELSGFPDIGAEEFNFIAAKFLDAGAAY